MEKVILTSGVPGPFFKQWYWWVARRPPVSCRWAPHFFTVAVNAIWNWRLSPPWLHAGHSEIWSFECKLASFPARTPSWDCDLRKMVTFVTWPSSRTEFLVSRDRSLRMGFSLSPPWLHAVHSEIRSFDPNLKMGNPTSIWENWRHKTTVTMSVIVHGRHVTLVFPQHVVLHLAVTALIYFTFQGVFRWSNNVFKFFLSLHLLPMSLEYMFMYNPLCAELSL